MKYLFYISVLITMPSLLDAQACEHAYNKAHALFRDGEYELALKKLAAYKVCAPEKTKRADSLIFRIYSTVNSQKNEAIKQKNIANMRSLIIKKQKDSIEKENIANRAATQALQINEIDPLKAIEVVLAGQCFSSQNVSLIEIKRKILSDEIMRTTLEGASKNNTLCFGKLSKEQLVSADSDGYIKFWDAATFTLKKSVKLFNGSVTALGIIENKYILVSGNDSKDYRHPNYGLKLFKAGEDSQLLCTISEFPLPFTFIAPMGDSAHFILATEQGLISRFSATDYLIDTIKKENSKITGLETWQKTGKIFYATPVGVYELPLNKEIYKAKQSVFITSLGFCQSTADMYIGIGQDLILFNYITQKDQLLYPVHKGMISSCHCADSTGGFLTTSLDNNAVLWTYNGNLKQVLKGNRAELYNGYLSPEGNFAVTVGRREMNAGLNADTSTIKLWHTKGPLIKTVVDAHFFDVTSVVCAGETNFISSGIDGNIKVWDSTLNLIAVKKIAEEGISKIKWDNNRKQIVYGTLGGKSGTLQIKKDGNLGRVDFIISHPSSMVTGVEICNDKLYSIGKDGMMFVQSYENERLDSVYFNTGLNSIEFSEDKKNILLSAGNNVIVYNTVSKSKRIYAHKVRVNKAVWLSKKRFVSISGQFLRVWDTGQDAKPVIEVNNNIQNEMTSLVIDSKNQVIYTGTWSGYIICWDYLGNKIYEFDQLTSLANTNMIQEIAVDVQKNKIITADNNGVLGSFYSPLYFLNNRLKLTVSCKEIVKSIK